MDSDAVATAVIRSTEESGRDAATLSLSEIAAAAGVSRATLVRRIGGRAEVDALLAAHGVTRLAPADRLINAATMIIAGDGVEGLTLERLAGDAGCTVPTIYDHLGGRDQVLVAVFRRQAVLPQLEPLLDSTDGLEPTIRRIHRTLLAIGHDDSAVATALMIDAIGRRNSALAAHLRDNYLPEASRRLGHFLTERIDAGEIRALPIPSLLALLFGPIQHCLETAMITGELGPKTRRRLADDLSAAFVRAVTVTPHPEPVDRTRES